MHIYNTMTRLKEEFVPLKPNEVSMYVCGPTVYDLMHIGNARPQVVFDTFRRYLLSRGWKVRYVQNFTDIDDRIIKKSMDSGIPAADVAEKYLGEAKTDMAGLNSLPATVAPRATEVVEDIISMVQVLIDKGFAYEVNGTVFYKTEKFAEYGSLSGKNPDDLRYGARVDINGDKQSPMDFVLWKSQKPGEPAWQSPWGMGRPGWHIECSAMCKKYLGDTFDIHAGGEDLIFPHHENEIAQSEASNGVKFARYWMHVGFLMINGEKMSKSLGNFLTIRDAATRWSYEALRFLLLTTHYRSPINFSDALMQSTKASLERIRNCASLLSYRQGQSNPAKQQSDTVGTPLRDEIIPAAERIVSQFNAALEDDLNTPNAITAVFDLVRLANIHMNTLSAPTAGELLSILADLTDILGIKIKEDTAATDRHIEIEALISKRQESRKAKDFAASDAIRKQLSDLGVVVEDRADGPRWYFADKSDYR
jgi:cysteinyl-tRNA synthetase